ncbi:TonB-dependent siderophore receptor [Caldimonas tepidiphila]|uniref:TonB-dependent siderophore receptor n=1 Tax=Caldimonas tepidiphila TaxID=2315841 RepID=UPI001300AE6A|nr:TonB-dependent siderophore receptor [Caldimonas tepidiphila]
MSDIVVTGSAPVRSERSGAYTVRHSRSATGLALSPRETPQSVSVVTRSQMDDFGLNSVNKVLDATPGVTVEKVETDRTYYTSRGFDITNFQVDGIGLPFAYGNVLGDLDTAIYDRVEVTRGATGLMSGTGNPSATVNYVRKRPTAVLQASAGLTLGSWNDRRVEADVAGPLTPSRSVRGRLVVAAQDRDSYLDRYSQDKHVLHGALETDLGDRTVLTLGHTRQENRPRGVLWGALPLNYTDGTPTAYDRSTSTSADWTYWNNSTATTFMEALHELDGGWSARAVLTRVDLSSDGKLFYVYGTPDRSTGAGLFAYPSHYQLDNTQKILDLRANGPFELGGRKHELVFGASLAKSELQDRSMHGQGIGTALPDLTTWDGNYPEPAFTVAGGGSDLSERQRSAYAAARINPADDLKLILGANATSVETTGTSYGASRARTETRTSPYVGAIYDVTPGWSVYASRTAIFKPQSEVDASFERLAPATGSSVEAGVKGEWFDKRLNGSFALFKTRQDNLASNARYVGIQAVHEGVNTLARGFELELSGAVTQRLKINAGYTQLSIEDDAGREARTFTPRRLLRVAGTYQVPVIEKLKVGAALNARSATHRDQGSGTPVRQPGYALLDLMARYDFSERLSATVNLNNATDKRYLTSLYWAQGYYGAPRHGSVSLNWKY